MEILDNIFYGYCFGIAGAGTILAALLTLARHPQFQRRAYCFALTILFAIAVFFERRWLFGGGI